MQHVIEIISSFINMGGYGRFVWPAYGLMIVFFLISFWLPVRKYNRIRAKLRGKD